MSASVGTGVRQPPWLERIRRTASERFAGLGYPTSRLEDWKFTNVGPIANTDFHPAPPVSDLRPESLASLPFGDLGCSRLVFVNGQFVPRLSSLPQEVRAGSLAEALPALEPHLGRYARFEDQAFVALNTASLNDGAFVEVPKGVVLDKPIQLLFVTVTNAVPVKTQPRSLILVGRGAQASFIETYLSLGESLHFTNAVTELVLSENAVVEHSKLQLENPQSFHIGTVQARQDRSSSLVCHNMALGGALLRNDVNSVLDAEGAECWLQGLYVAGGKQHVDNHTTLDHAKPHCSSRELYKGILDGRASAVFNGKIIVRKDAQKTDSKQTNKNLLLSEDATINTKPQLEIHADDVKCTHGATIGQLGEEALFYLRSRGIPLPDARAMLTYAFAGDLLGRVQYEPLRAGLDHLLLDLLRRGQS